MGREPNPVFTTVAARPHRRSHTLNDAPPHTRPFEGTIFMDTPDPSDLGETISMIRNRDEWIKLCTPDGLGAHSETRKSTRTRPRRLSHGREIARAMVIAGGVGLFSDR